MSVRTSCAAFNRLTFRVLRRDARNRVVLEQVLGALVGTELHVALRAERRVRSDRDAEGATQLDQGLLRQVRVQLDLVDRRLVFGVAEDVDEQRALDVAIHTG